MNKKVLIMFASIVVVLVAALAGVTYAWLTDTDSVTQVYTVGDVEYAITGQSASRIVVPGVNLLASEHGGVPIAVTNSSNVKTQLRVRVDVSVTGNGTIPDDPNGTSIKIGETATFLTPTAIGTRTEHILVVKNTNWNRAMTSATEASNVWYYGAITYASGTFGTVDSSGIIETNQLTTATNLFESLQLNGEIIGNNYTGVVITLTFVFEAKQSDGVLWSELATLSVDFSTGL